MRGSNIIGGQEEATLAKETEKEGSRCRRKPESDAVKAKGGSVSTGCKWPVLKAAGRTEERPSRSAPQRLLTTSGQSFQWFSEWFQWSCSVVQWFCECQVGQTEEGEVQK